MLLSMLLAPRKRSLRAFKAFRTLLLLAAISTGSFAQGTLSNGGIHTGAIASGGETDSWTFAGTAGSSLYLRIGATNFPPRLRVFNPDNVLIGEVSASNLSIRDVVLALGTTNNGSYTVIVSSATAGTGTYGLNVAAAPGDFIVPPGDEGGPMESGANNPGIIALGDLDLWRFTANAGDSVMLRMGGAFTPLIRVYGPSGALVDDVVSGNLNTRDVVLTMTATNAGVYLVVAGSTVAGGIGPYALHLAQVPAPVVVSTGDQGGDLANGARNTGEIVLGDLDVWHFTATAGDSLSLRMGAAFTPWIRLYGPGGTLVGEAVAGNLNTRDVFLNAKATNSGTYVASVSSTVSGGIGSYDLQLVKAPGDFVVSPGDEGGPLTNGVNNAGTISLGDIDLWRFEAAAGDELMLRMGGVFTPLIRLYGPDGALAGEAVSGNLNTRDVVLTKTATNSGTYLVAVSSTVASGVGAYNLHLARADEFIVSTNDQGGVLRSGADQEGTIEQGDLDLWSFTAQAGDGVVLRMGGAFTPWIRVLAPDGTIAANVVSGNLNTRDVVATLVATNAGTYTVIASSTVASGIGSYHLHLALGRGEITVSAGDEGGILINGATNNAVLSLGDLDVWTFNGTVGDSNVFRIPTAAFAPWIRLYNPNGTLVAESLPGNLNVRSANLVYELTNSPGAYTIVISSGVASQLGAYTFKQSRWAPDLNVPETISIDEDLLLNTSISAQDPDEPDKPLQFTFHSVHPGVTFTISGPTNAALTWQTSEADGPATNVFTASVTDVVNGRSFSRTNDFRLIVREINLAPQLTAPADAVVNELSPLTVSASATDADLPSNALTFSLLSPPEGMTINPATGAISWTPTEAQGPSTNAIAVVVTDDSPFAANAQNLSATNTFTVIVREVNVAPQLSVPASATAEELKALSAGFLVVDADQPANAQVFRLVDAPAGMTINAGTGVITWTPSEAQGPSTNVVVVAVTDNSPLAVNSTQLSATNNLTVIVAEANVAPVLSAQADRTVAEGTELTINNSGTDADLPENTLSYALLSGPANAAISANGTITWTPAEADGPGTNAFVTVVTDNGNPALRATNTLNVIVSEVNTAPVLDEISAQSGRYGFRLTVRLTASDADSPTNTLTFTVEQGPTNLMVTPAGELTWTPVQSQVGAHDVTVRVHDNGSPNLSGTRTFQIQISGEETRLQIGRLETGLMQITINGNSGVNYELERTSDLSTWEKEFEFRLITSPFLYIDPNSQGQARRYYRLKTGQSN